MEAQTKSARRARGANNRSQEVLYLVVKGGSEPHTTQMGSQRATQLNKRARRMQLVYIDAQSFSPGWHPAPESNPGPHNSPHNRWNTATSPKHQQTR